MLQLIPLVRRMKNGRGTLAQYTLALPGALALKPANISHVDAAAFPLAGLTAYYALVTVGGLKKGAGQRVFIVRFSLLFEMTS